MADKAIQSTPRCAALVVAGGRGRRLGGELPKQFLPLAGRPLLAHCLAAFQRCPDVVEVVLVVPRGYQGQAADLVRAHDLDKVTACVPGGAERGDSVRAGLAALPKATRLVAVHDGARPLITPELIARVVAEAARSGAALPALPVQDTVKRAEPGRPLRTVDRGPLRLAQTPQVFAAELLLRAHAQGGDPGEATDDAQLVERLGHAVTLVPGDPDNIKVTVPGDLRLAEALLGGGAGPGPRVGTGEDVHRLVRGRALVLGGVRVPHDRGLLGHSDADVLAHAAADALLGAAGLGDLGRHFPDDDPRYRGADSLALLAEVARRVGQLGLVVGNLDATLSCQAPRLSPHLPAMARNLARALGVEAARVSVKATTTEGLGFVGRGEGIAAQAVVLLQDRTFGGRALSKL